MDVVAEIDNMVGSAILRAVHRFLDLLVRDDCVRAALAIVECCAAIIAFFLSLSNSKRNDSDSNVWLIVFLVIFGLQRVPIVALAVLIVMQRGSAPDGPTKRTKAYLIIATILNVVNDLPLNVWAGILPSLCSLPLRPFFIAVSSSSRFCGTMRLFVCLSVPLNRRLRILVGKLG